MIDLMKKFWVQGTVIAGLLATGATVQSCSDEEIAVGAAVVAVGAAISAGSNHGQCTYKERVCRTYTDYWGHIQKQCKIVKRRRRCGSHGGHHHGHYYRNDTFAGMDAAASLRTLNIVEETPVAEYLDVADLSKRYYLSLDSAELFINALEEARNGDLSAIGELGLNSDDMQRMARLLVPEDESIDRLAQNLDQDPQLTKGMLSKIVVHGRKMKREACKAERERSPNKRIYDHFCINQ